jgi:hypothetical protein
MYLRSAAGVEVHLRLPERIRVWRQVFLEAKEIAVAWVLVVVGLDFCVSRNTCFTEATEHRVGYTRCDTSGHPLHRRYADRPRRRAYEGDERDDRDEGDVVPCVSGVPDDQNRLALSAFSVLRGGLPPQPLNRKFQGAHLGG